MPEAEAAPTVLTLELLARFLRSPVKAFFRHRLGVVFDEADALTEDEERFALDGLEAHGLLGRLLEQAVGAAGEAQAPVNAATLVQQIQREGALPWAGRGRKWPRPWPRCWASNWLPGRANRPSGPSRRPIAR